MLLIYILQNILYINIYRDEQFGFRPGLSTTRQLARLVERVNIYAERETDRQKYTYTQNFSECVNRKDGGNINLEIEVLIEKPKHAAFMRKYSVLLHIHDRRLVDLSQCRTCGKTGIMSSLNRPFILMYSTAHFNNNFNE